MAYKDYSTQSISHQIRNQLKVACDEYCMLLYLYDYFDGKKVKTFKFDAVLSKKITKNLFFDLQKQVDLFRSLIEKGFFTKIGNNHLQREDKSIIFFEPNKDVFEELWAYYGKIGNKQKAIDAYKMSIRKYSHEFFMERVRLYLDHLEITGQAQLHLSSFLNLKNKQFLNEFKVSKSIKNDKDTFFK